MFVMKRCRGFAESAVQSQGVTWKTAIIQTNIMHTYASCKTSDRVWWCRGLADSGVQPQDVTYVNAHGTSTPVGMHSVPLLCCLPVLAWLLHGCMHTAWLLHGCINVARQLHDCMHSCKCICLCVNLLSTPDIFSIWRAVYVFPVWQLFVCLVERPAGRPALMSHSVCIESY